MEERIAISDELYYAPLGEWLENHMFPSPDGGMVSVQRYVTERKRAEEALRRSEAYLAEGQRIGHTGSWAWNPASGEIFWSAEHFRIFGMEPSHQAPGYPDMLRLVHPDDRAMVAVAFEKASRERVDYQVDCRIVRADGGVRYVQSRARPVFDPAGALVEYIGTVMDTTEQRQAEAKLEQAQAAAQKARDDLAHVNRSLTVAELTASIAHELNQPLAAVVTNANACERWLAGPSPNIEEAHLSLRRIARDANRASDVIGRIRALLTKRGPKRAELSIAELIADVVSIAEGEARAKGVTMKISVEDALPPIMADRVQIQQVVLNLLANAIEAMRSFARSRALEVRVERRGAEIVVSVEDSGMGLPPKHAERIFEAFYSTKGDGMGMGLAISRSIVEAHGGRLRAMNNEGRPGATFQFTLPVPT
jgi:PAS domain S-box-containing protein